MRSLFRSVARCVTTSVLLGAVTGCVGPLRGARGISSDRVLIFEQRVASSDPAAQAAWESWQLYESGRFVYVRAGAEPTQRRVETARLQAVHGWLYAHDAELQRTPPPQAAVPPASSVSAMCQVHTSRGLLLAAPDDPRYGVCDELKKLVAPE